MIINRPKYQSFLETVT